MKALQRKISSHSRMRIFFFGIKKGITVLGLDKNVARKQNHPEGIEFKFQIVQLKYLTHTQTRNVLF